MSEFLSSLFFFFRFLELHFLPPTADEKFINFSLFLLLLLLSFPAAFTQSFCIWHEIIFFFHIFFFHLFRKKRKAREREKEEVRDPKEENINWINPEKLHLVTVKCENNDDTSRQHFVSSWCLKYNSMEPLESDMMRWELMHKNQWTSHQRKQSFEGVDWDLSSASLSSIERLSSTAANNTESQICHLTHAYLMGLKDQNKLIPDEYCVSTVHF